MLFLLTGLLKDLRLVVCWLKTAKRRISCWLTLQDFIILDPFGGFYYVRTWDVNVFSFFPTYLISRPSLKEQVYHAALRITVLIIQIYSD